jgi:hypothetical protein
MKSSAQSNKSYLAELILSFLAAAICIAAGLVVASWQPGDFWPLPGAYMIEVAAVSLIGLLSRARDTSPSNVDWGAVTWAASGVLLAFVILGGFSIGPFLAPAMLALALAGLLGDLRQGRGPLPHAGLMLVAALLQSALMFVVIGLFRNV